MIQCKTSIQDIFVIGVVNLYAKTVQPMENVFQMVAISVMNVLENKRKTHEGTGGYRRAREAAGK